MNRPVVSASTGVHTAYARAKKLMKSPTRESDTPKSRDSSASMPMTANSAHPRTNPSTTSSAMHSPGRATPGCAAPGWAASVWAVPDREVSGRAASAWETSAWGRSAKTASSRAPPSRTAETSTDADISAPTHPFIVRTCPAPQRHGAAARHPQAPYSTTRTARVHADGVGVPGGMHRLATTSRHRGHKETGARPAHEPHPRPNRNTSTAAHQSQRLNRSRLVVMPRHRGPTSQLRRYASFARFSPAMRPNTIGFARPMRSMLPADSPAA